MPGLVVITASIGGTILGSVVIPVIVAALTAAAALLITRAGDAANRRRDRYAQAMQTLVAWVEFPYRVRRRVDDAPETLSQLAGIGHDLQETLACHQAWIATEHPGVARAYAETRRTLAAIVGQAVTDAWNAQPIARAADMNLGPWGPAATAAQPLADLQGQIESRFGLRRVGSLVSPPGGRAQSR
jgi:hypothetical protein